MPGPLRLCWSVGQGATCAQYATWYSSPPPVRLIQPWATVPFGRPALTVMASLALPLAGTVIDDGVAIRLSAPPIEPAFQTPAMAPAPVVGAGVNRISATSNVWAVPVRLLTLIAIVVGPVLLALIRSKLARVGQKVASVAAASARSSRPAP